MSAMFSQLPFGGGVSIALAPVDLSSAATTTLYAKVRDINDFLWLVFFLKAGTAADEATLNLVQATSAAGANAKVLNIKEVWFKKGGPTFATAPATNDLWTKSALATREASIATYATATDRVAATNDFMAAIRISPKDLDAAGGFGWVRGGCTDVGTNAQLGMAFWIPEGIAYSGTAAPSILA
jgi:hypothetical protein